MKVFKRYVWCSQAMVSITIGGYYRAVRRTERALTMQPMVQFNGTFYGSEQNFLVPFFLVSSKMISCKKFAVGCLFMIFCSRSVDKGELLDERHERERTEAERRRRRQLEQRLCYDDSLAWLFLNIRRKSHECVTSFRQRLTCVCH